MNKVITLMMLLTAQMMAQTDREIHRIINYNSTSHTVWVYFLGMIAVGFVIAIAIGWYNQLNDEILDVETDENGYNITPQQKRIRNESAQIEADYLKKMMESAK